jgi:hypothetical protein
VRKSDQFHEFVRPHLLHPLALGDLSNAAHSATIARYGSKYYHEI